MSTSLPALSPLSSAIAQAEGYGVGNNIPTQANNPGNLELGDLGNGTITAAGGNQITIFKSAEDGWAALENQVQKIFNGTSSHYNPDMSLSDFGSTYSGGNPAYGSTLASILGTSPDTSLASANGTSKTTGGIGGALNDVFGPSIFGMTAGPSATNATFSLSRLIVIVIGLILLIAGVFSFKQTQVIISGAAKTVKKGAEVAAA